MREAKLPSVLPLYNWHRYYDPKIGRYITSDPIGLEAGLNTYSYVFSNPLKLSDSNGLSSYMCKKPLDAIGGGGTRSGPDISGNPLYHEYICVKKGKVTICGGQDRSGGPWSPGKPSDPKNDKFDPQRCEKKDDRSCMDDCLMRAIQNPERPPYGLLGPGTNCQEWAGSTYMQCAYDCRGKQ